MDIFPESILEFAMGTWGSGPFDSDSAEDFLDKLEELAAAQRLAVVERTLQTAIEEGGTVSSSILPEEVIAAAAVVAANIGTRHQVVMNEDYPDLGEWLPGPIPLSLATSAIRALEVTAPVDGWYWRSWVDDEERLEAQAAVGTVRSILQGVSER